MQVCDGTLLGRQFAEGAANGVPEALGIGIRGGGEDFHRLASGALDGARMGGATAKGVDGDTVREADQITAQVAHGIEVGGIGGELKEKLLQYVTRLRFATR